MNNTETPKILYKFLGVDRAMKTPTGKSLKYSPPNSFNDPFEFMPGGYTGDTPEKRVKRVKQTFLSNPNYGIYLAKRLGITIAEPDWKTFTSKFTNVQNFADDVFEKLQNRNWHDFVDNASTLSQLAAAINIIGAFCGKRDIERLTADALEQAFGIRQVDVAVLFGGSIYSGGDLFAEAIRNRLARKFVIVGGEGHTTAVLRQQIHAVCPAMTTDGRSEAEIFAGYLQTQYGFRPDALECQSTNCGNNITFLQTLMHERAWPCRSILFLQDATMQHRMEATFRKFFAPETLLVNFAAYQAQVVDDDGKLCFSTTIPGMWEMERYLSLLMGEIPRLTDDAEGYGPQGKNYIAHVNIPATVQEAWRLLKTQFPDSVRIADARYA